MNPGVQVTASWPIQTKWRRVGCVKRYAPDRRYVQGTLDAIERISPTVQKYTVREPDGTRYVIDNRVGSVEPA